MTIETLEILIGAVLPPFIQILNQRVGSSSWRYVISIGVCLGIGAVSTVLSGQLIVSDILTTAGIVFASAQTTYRLFFSNTEMGRKLMVGN